MAKRTAADNRPCTPRAGAEAETSERSAESSANNWTSGLAEGLMQRVVMPLLFLTATQPGYTANCQPDQRPDDDAGRFGDGAVDAHEVQGNAKRAAIRPLRRRSVQR